MIPVESIAWLLGGLLALAGGWAAAWGGKPGARQAPRMRAAFYLAVGALACVGAVGVGQAAGWASWTYGTGSESLALLAGGALGCLLWQGRQRRAGPAGGFVAAGLSLLIAAALAWHAPVTTPAPQMRTWLFGLRSLLAGLGLGGWLIIGAAVLEEAGRDLAAWRGRSLRPVADGAAAAEAGDGAIGGGARVATEADQAATGEALPASASASASASTSAGAATPEPARPEGEAPAPEPGTAIARALSALGFSYPWLTAAILGAGLWNAVAFATPWRSRPADLWLVVAWLIGAACLHLSSRREGSRLRLAVLAALALCGLAAALLAALNAPTLLS